WAPFNSAITLVGTKGFADYEFLAGAPTEASDGIVSEYRLAAESAVSTEAIGGADPYTAQVAYFLKCVAEGIQPDYTSTASAVRALEVSLAAAESMRTGLPVAIESRVSDAAVRDVAAR